MTDNTGSKLMAGFIQRDKLKAAEALKTASIRIVKQSECPHLILSARHYREDGTCKCNDKNETVMREWGYKWKNGQWR